MSGEPVVPSDPIPGETVASPPPEVAPDHDVRAVLRITPFRRLWMALALSSFGDWLGLLAIVAMAQNLAGESYADANFAVGGVLLLRLAPAVLIGPVAGALADRLNRKFTLVVGDLARFALFLSIPLVGTLPWLFVATVLIECLALFWLPAKDATVPNLVPKNRLEAANQISLVATYGTAPIAAAVFTGVALLNGILDNSLSSLEAKPVDLALYVNALTYLVAAVTVARLTIPGRRTACRVQEQSLVRTIVDGWRFIGVTPLVRGLVVGMLGAFAAAGFVIGLAAGFVRDLGGGQPGFGVLFGAVFVGLAAGMWLGPRLLRGFSRRRLFGLSIVVSGLFLVALALVPNIVMATLFTLGLGAGGGVAWVTGYTLLGLEVDDEVRGRTFAFLQSAARIVLVLVLAAAPTLAGVIGAHTFRFTDHFALVYNGAAFVFLLAGLLAIAVGAIAYRQMDDRPGASLRRDLAAAVASVTSGSGVDDDTPLHPYPGLFVVVEGGDGAGKSTQARLLTEWLRADQLHDVVLTREPGATPLGARLRALLLDPQQKLDARTEALLFAADRAHHVESTILPALERGAVVVSDRYVDSSIAYQGGGRSLEADAVARLSRWATKGLVPDLTVLLDVSGELAARRRAEDESRSGDDRMEAESDGFHERVRARFLELARREPHRYLVVAADAPAEEIQAVIRSRVRELRPISPLRRAELTRRLEVEEAARRRRAEAEAQVLRLDAELRAQRHDEERIRLEKQRVARLEAERQLLAEIEAGPGRPAAPAEAAISDPVGAEEVAAEQVAAEQVAADQVAAEQVEASPSGETRAPAVAPTVEAPAVDTPPAEPPAVEPAASARTVVLPTATGATSEAPASPDRSPDRDAEVTAEVVAVPAGTGSPAPEPGRASAVTELLPAIPGRALLERLRTRGRGEEAGGSAPSGPAREGRPVPLEPAGPPPYRTEPQPTVAIPIGVVNTGDREIALGDLLFEELGQPDDEVGGPSGVQGAPGAAEDPAAQQRRGGTGRTP